MTIARSLAVLGLLGVLAACGDEGGSGDVRAADPSGTTYVVTGVTVKGERYDLVPGSQIRLAFSDDQLSISAGCNSMSGSYAVDQHNLTVSSLATTDMGCDEPLMKQDAWVAGLFEKTVQFTPGEDASVISGDTVLTLADRESVAPDEPLVGTDWILDSIGTGASSPDGVVSSVPESAGATLIVRADGTFLARWGCGSNIGGPAKIVGDTITWVPEAQGIADCVKVVDGAEEAGDALNGVLMGRTAFTIEENHLTITGGDRSLGFTAKS